MKKYATKVGIYDANTGIKIDTYTLTGSARCQQINDIRALSTAKNIYRAARLAELANRYGGVIYRLADEGIIEPLSIYDFCILNKNQ